MKITQLEARTRAYGSRKRVYMECTVSTEEGRTWQEYMNNDAGRRYLPVVERPHTCLCAKDLDLRAAQLLRAFTHPQLK